MRAIAPAGIQIPKGRQALDSTAARVSSRRWACVRLLLVVLFMLDSGRVLVDICNYAAYHM